jgi:hypothetical protein
MQQRKIHNVESSLQARMHITQDTVQTKEVTIETQNKMTSPIEGESRRQGRREGGTSGGAATPNDSLVP